MFESLTTLRTLVLGCFASVLVAACGSDSGGQSKGNGGTTASGGPSAGGGHSGGASTASGGATTGGNTASGGGATATGGTGGTCAPPQAPCNGQCTDITTNARNCGACGNACAAGQTCSGGHCTCASGQLCGSACADTQNDGANCGGCGHACAARQYCNAGTCVAAATCPDNSAATGWATQGGSTTGGGSASPTTVTSLSQLNSAAGGSTARVITVSGTISGDVTVGSNKTIVGACGGTATIKGHIQMDGSKNVILRNLNVVGYNCTDSPSDCSAGADAITIENSANHIFIDHCDISDGSDGNLDITHGSDYITIAWTKFHYSGVRAGGHQFSNLIGHSATNGSEDSGHLRVTFDHVWWADHVDQRMPRVRFGHVHVFNGLYTSIGDTYCVGVGTDANILLENSVFVNVKNPIDTSNVDPTAASVCESNGNVFSGTTGSSSPVGSGSAFTPPYTYTLEAATSVRSHVQAGAGPL